jgi:beta-galactosidase
VLGAAAARGEVALVHDYDSRFALQVQPTNEALGYEATVQSHYEALRSLGLGVDVIPDVTGLEAYRIVVAPSLYICDPEIASALSTYVRHGGTLVLAPRTAVKDRHGTAPERPLPVWLDELCGVKVSDYQSVGADRLVRVEGASLDGEFRGWYEELEVDGADVLATYASGAFAGTAAITARSFGDGSAVYVAGAATPVTLDGLYRHLADRTGLGVLELPFGLEAVRLDGSGNGELMMLLNHADRPQRLVRDGYRWHDQLTGKQGDGPFELGPYGVALLEGVR